MNELEKIQRETQREDIPEFEVGDTIRVNVRIVEGGSERVQPFTGLVIARKGGDKNPAVTVRRVSYGQGVERVFPLDSPRISDIKVVRKGKSKRSKLYYVREKKGRVAGMK